MCPSSATHRRSSRRTTGDYFLPAPAKVPSMDAKTEELRAAHDVLAEFYAARLATALDHMPEEQAVLGLFCQWPRAAGVGPSVADIGCGPGPLRPFLAGRST